MRIQKLLEELVQTQRQEKSYRGVMSGYNPKANKNNAADLGVGHYARVRQDKTDPHMVVKSGHRPESEDDGKDAFESYIDHIIKHKLQDNIHFPRVYNTKRITDRIQQSIVKYQIEKLVKWSELSKEELESVAESHFNFDSEAFSNIKTGEGMSDEKKLMRWMREAMRRATHRGDYSLIKLDSLKDALFEVVKIAKYTDNDLDLHGENFMYRRTPHGLQLVLADPLQ